MKIHNHLNTISPIPLWQNILSYLIIFVGQLFVYLPVLTNKYLLPDDYEYLYEGLIHSDKFTVQAIAQARLFNALVAPALAWIGNIDDMWIIRLIGLLGIFALAICLFHTFKKYGENIFLSAIFALLITIMPAFQEYASWAVLFLAPWAAVIAYFAFLSMEKSLTATKLKKWLWNVLAVVLLVFAYNIHPTSATFTAVFITIFFFYNTGAKKFSQTLFFLIMSGLGAIAHFITFKIYLFLFNTPFLARAAFLEDPVEKLSWFITRPLLKAFNLIYLPPSGTVATTVAAIIIVGLILHFIQQKQKKDIPINFIFILLFILLSYSSNLIIDENLANYRTLLALSGVVTVIAIVALQSFVRMVKKNSTRDTIQYSTFIVITIASMIFALQGYDNLLIQPVARNLQELRQAATSFDPQKHTKVIFTYMGDKEYKLALRHDYALILKLALFEKNPQPFEQIIVELKKQDETIGEDTLVLKVSDFTPVQ